jgi:hypothetical protein
MKWKTTSVPTTLSGKGIEKEVCPRLLFRILYIRVLPANLEPLSLFGAAFSFLTLAGLLI